MQSDPSLSYPLTDAEMHEALNRGRVARAEAVSAAFSWLFRTRQAAPTKRTATTTLAPVVAPASADGGVVTHPAVAELKVAALVRNLPIGQRPGRMKKLEHAVEVGVD